MCSIAGFYNHTQDYTKSNDKYIGILKRMNEVQRHRGPDASGHVLESCCGLAHNRLSIRDIKKGEQPMTGCIGENRIHIVYNGEIYNADELRQKLKTYGVSFDTTSDTEVILRCFMHYGADFVSMLNGIFAFAIYDEHIRTLYLYRDHFGVKPLYYASAPDKTTVFGSELKSVLVWPDIRPVIDRQGLCEVFGIGPSKTPGFGVYKSIREVKPGHFVKMSPDGESDFTYFRITSRPHTDSYADTVDTVRYLVKDSIERQIVSDVPICTFLSGGIDSSIVSSVCAAKLMERGEKLHTFSFDFTGNSKYFKANSFQPEQDRPYVDMMLRHIGSEHTYLSCDYGELADCLYASVRSRDLPTMADVDSSLLYFCSLVAKDFKVVLTGECADEIFGGYPWFYRENLLAADTFPWMSDLTPRLSVLSEDVRNTLDIPGYVCKLYHSLLSEINLLPEESDTEKKRRQTAYINIRMFMQTLLDRMDRTSMAAGLEARVPFADPRIVNYVFNVPWAYKYENGVEKKLLREAMKDFVPHEIMYRKKSPYPKSYDPHYEQVLAERLREVITDHSSPINDIIDKGYVMSFLDAPKDYGMPWFGQLMAGPQMMAYLLQVNYWLKEYKVEIEL